MNTFRDDMIIYLEKILVLRSGYKTGTGYYANIKLKLLSSNEQ